MGEGPAPKAGAAPGVCSEVGHASLPTGGAESSGPMKGRNYQLSSTSGEGEQVSG